jgi:hypothetical protein
LRPPAAAAATAIAAAGLLGAVTQIAACGHSPAPGSRPSGSQPSSSQPSGSQPSGSRSSGSGSSSSPAQPPSPAPQATTPTPAVASLGPQLDACVAQWNAASNQIVRFGFDGEVLAAASTPAQKMLVTRTAGRCSLVFAGSGADAPRIWSREAGVWSAQAVLGGETALTAEVMLARSRPNVTAAITSPPDEEAPTIGDLVPLPRAG